jgi:hypothetical protein
VPVGVVIPTNAVRWWKLLDDWISDIFPYLFNNVYFTASVNFVEQGLCRNCKVAEWRGFRQI